MSARDRERAAARGRRKRGPRSVDEVFASMRADHLLDALLRHAPHGAAGRTAVRVLLLAHAAWRPGAESLSGGEAVLPYEVIARPLRQMRAEPTPAPGRATISEALKRLTADDHGDLVLAKAGTAPRRAGGGRGEAATYRVPARHGSDAPQLNWRWQVQRPKGSVRLHVQRIRHDCASLAPIALCVLVLAVAQHDRHRDGSLVQSTPFTLPLEQVAQRLGVSEAAISAARDELVEAGRLFRHDAPSGRRPATFRLAAAYAKRLAGSVKENDG